MGRGRVQLKRIENKIRRQVTFSKRRTGLLKKAREISVLCDVEIALIVFSAKGKLFEYSAGSSMESIIDRYERYAIVGEKSSATELERTDSMEYSKLKKLHETLQKSMRHLKGEDLDGLSPRELQSLELQLDSALKRIRSRKNIGMLEFISQLQKKEKELKEQNDQLTIKLNQATSEAMVASDNQAEDLQNLSQGSSSSAAQRPPTPQLRTLFPLSLSDGDERREASRLEEATRQPEPPTTCRLPHWLRRRQEE